MTVSFEVDCARADTMAVAYLVTDTEPGGTIMVRGWRYRECWRGRRA